MLIRLLIITQSCLNESRKINFERKKKLIFQLCINFHAREGEKKNEVTTTKFIIAENEMSIRNAPDMIE